MTQNKLSFYLLALSQGIGLIGGATLRFAISLHVLDITGSAEIFATMIAVSFIPFVLLMPIGGAIADRLPKKALLVVCDSASAATVAALAIMFFGGGQSIVLMGAAITLLTILSTLYFPTVTASLPTILDKDALVKANGVVQGIKAVSALLSPMLAGVLFSEIGVTNLVAICAVLFLFSSIINVFIKIPHKKLLADKGLVSSIASDLKEGFLHMSRVNKMLLKTAFIFTAIMFFHQSMLTIAFPYMIRVGLDKSEMFFGIGNAAVGLAILTASIMAGRLKKYMRLDNMGNLIMAIGLSTILVSIAAMPMAGNTMLPFVLLTTGFSLTMGSFTFVNIMIMTHVQSNVPAHLIGKVVAIVISIANASAPIGQYLLGLLIDGLAGYQFVLYGAIAAITVALGLLSKKTLKKPRHTASPTTP